MGMIDKFKNLFSQKKSVPYFDVLSETTREGINKAYIPKFLYKPPFGYPRFANMPYIRYLAKTPYVDMCLDTILKEMESIKWNVLPNPDVPKEVYKDKNGDFKEDIQGEINHIKTFLKNPNTNKETFKQVFIKQFMGDDLEINSGVLNKVFNLKGEMVEIVARDGATFTKNPDIHGMYTNRAELILPKEIVNNPSEVINPFRQISHSMAYQEAAYFQYGWISGPVPTPFGKREIIWLQSKFRSDDIYAYSPIQVLAKSLQMLLYHIESDLEYYNDNNVPKGIIGIDASDTDEIKSFRDQWNEAQQKKDEFGNWKKMMHKVPIVNYIPHFERIEFSSQEMELIEKQKWYSKMVWACFGVTSTELGYTEDASGTANQIVQSKVFRKRAINPRLHGLSDLLNMEVLPEFEYTVDITIGKKKLPVPKYIFKFDMFDIDEERNKYELYKLQTESGLKTINEIRMEEGDEPLDWGDDPPSSWKQAENSFFMGNNQPSFSKRERDAQDTSENTNKEKRTVNPDKTKKKVEKEIANKKALETKKKALGSDNPLILKEGEKLDETKLQSAILHVLKQSEKKLLELVKEESKDDILKQIKAAYSKEDKNNIEIKSIQDLIQKVKSVLNMDAVKNVTRAVITASFLSSAKKAEKDINVFAPYQYVPDREAINFISSYTFDNIKVVSDELVADLQREFKMAFMNGEGSDKIAERVKKVFDSSENRAKTIARTETSRAHSFGKLSAWKESGFKARKWLLWTNDNRTSDITKALHSKYGSSEKAIPLNENFKMSIKVGKKMVIIDQQAGPFHPNERCALMIEWDEENT